MSGTLFYHGSSVEVRLGDRILFKKLFSKVAGEVVYVPGQSPLNNAVGDDTWLIQLEDEPGDVRQLVFYPDYEKYAPKKVTFIDRGDGKNSVGVNESIL